MKTEILSLTNEMLPQAGALLAQRHQRHRLQFPSLPSRFEQIDVATRALTKLFEKKSALGYAAFRNGEMLAYLLGDYSSEAWGRCGWVRLPGSAIAEGESTNTLQDLYVKLGDDWVRRGIFIHHSYLSVAEPALIDAWFGMDFGKERIDAMLDAQNLEIPEIAIPDDVIIRRAGKGDNTRFAGISHVIFRALEKSPYWHPTPSDVWDELKEGWAELADDESVAAWFALNGEQVLGTIASWTTMDPEADTDMDIFADEKIAYLSIAATHPESRGTGIGTALAWTCLSFIKQAGYDHCYTNWISPNLSASRFWPRFGFKEVAYRLTRNINPMISWTREG